MVRILLRFNEELVEQPIISHIILEHKVAVNIITAHVNSKGGEVLAEIPDESLEKIVTAFRQKGVEVSIPRLVEVDADKCFNCGICITLCPVEAINMDKDNTVIFNRERCVGSTCSACVDACPARAIRSVRQLNALKNKGARGKAEK